MGLLIVLVSLCTSFIVIFLNILLDTCSVKYVSFDSTIFIEDDVTRGSKIMLNYNPIRDGYDFIGWALEKGSSEVVSEVVVSNDIVLFATWRPKIHTLTYGGSEYSVYNGTVLNVIGNNITFKCVDGSSVTISGGSGFEWFVSDSIMNVSVGNNFLIDYAKNTNITLINKDTVPNYNINIATSDCYIVKTESFKARHGEDYVFIVELSSGYTNSNITLNTNINYDTVYKSGGVYEFTLHNVTQELNIDILGVTKNMHAIHIDYDGGMCVITKSPVFVEYGECLVLNTPIKKGYIFKYFVDVDTGIVVDGSTRVYRDMSIKAVYSIDTFKVSILGDFDGKMVVQHSGCNVDSGAIYEMNILDTITFKVNVSQMFDVNTLKVKASFSDKVTELYYYVVDNVAYVTIDDVYSDVSITFGGLDVRKYTLNIDYCGGVDSSGNSSAKITVHYGSLITVNGSELKIIDYIDNREMIVSNIVRMGATFKSWISKENVLTNGSVQSIYEVSDTISIKWNITEYIVTMYACGGYINGETKVTMCVSEFNEDIIPTKAGYTFLGWFTKLIEVNGVVDMDLSVRLDNTNINSDVIIYAGWAMSN